MDELGAGKDWHLQDMDKSMQLMDKSMQLIRENTAAALTTQNLVLERLSALQIVARSRRDKAHADGAKGPAHDEHMPAIPSLYSTYTPEATQRASPLAVKRRVSGRPRGPQDGAEQPRQRHPSSNEKPKGSLVFGNGRPLSAENDLVQVWKRGHTPELGGPEDQDLSTQTLSWRPEERDSQGMTHQGTRATASTQSMPATTYAHQRFTEAEERVRMAATLKERLIGLDERQRERERNSLGRRLQDGGGEGSSPHAFRSVVTKRGKPV